MAALPPGFAFSGMPIQLGGITFGQVDEEGVHWHCSTISGWDSPDVKTTVTPREAAHGSWMSPVYLAERVVTLAGKAFAPDRGAMDRAMEHLLAAASLTDTTLTVWETIPKQLTVRRSGKVLAERMTDRVLDWSVLLTAPDPRRYGTTLRTASTGLPSTTGGLVLPAAPPWTLSAATVSGFLQADNEGSIVSYPGLTITGPVQQPTVSVRYPDGTVTALAYNGELANGDVLTLATDTHTATVGGASRRRNLSGDWPQIPPGGAQILFGAAVYSATATLTAAWRPAWT
ncbi:hypothetical protein [Actinacidiphila sp. ITFR-21]|uniref:hypothetical protein n=1 Tax=Actinacidiphila sp. ITFR-21 TaxID=3075199 RepID=UPI0028894BA9|nr:hypothetical protein [Streptomyces sp. ITFR-21]WNI19690.1 hypothetical protein RLT57_14560 [Streptomyces sp. ITFR-21]